MSALHATWLLFYLVSPTTLLKHDCHGDVYREGMGASPVCCTDTPPSITYDSMRVRMGRSRRNTRHMVCVLSYICKFIFFVVRLEVFLFFIVLTFLKIPCSPLPPSLLTMSYSITRWLMPCSCSLAHVITTDRRFAVKGSKIWLHSTD